MPAAFLREHLFLSWANNLWGQQKDNRRAKDGLLKGTEEGSTLPGPALGQGRRGVGLGLWVGKCAASFLGSVWATTLGGHFAPGVFLKQKPSVLQSFARWTHTPMCCLSNPCRVRGCTQTVGLGSGYSCWSSCKQRSWALRGLWKPFLGRNIPVDEMLQPCHVGEQHEDVSGKVTED